MLLVLAIDIGGTHQRFACINEHGEILDKKTYEQGSLSSKELFFSQLKERISLFLSQKSCDGISLALPIIMDEKTYVVYDAPNLPFLVGSQLKQELSFLSLPWSVENDANCAALGEGWVGEGQRENSFCCLTLGTGIGSGLILDQKLWKGERGMASEMGHLKVDSSGQYPCACGDHGCLEAFASGRALYEKTGYSALTLYEMASQGSSYAQEVFKDMGRFLGRGIGSLANALNIETFILAGRIANAFDFFYPSAIRMAKESAMKGPQENLKILKSKLNDDAGLLGAAYKWLLSFRS